jgi:hypothetical protein
MPDAPTGRNLDVATLQREKKEREQSKLYWCHPTVTVWEYTRMSRAQQDAVNLECRQIERAKQSK